MTYYEKNIQPFQSDLRCRKCENPLNYVWHEHSNSMCRCPYWHPELWESRLLENADHLHADCSVCSIYYGVFWPADNPFGTGGGCEPEEQPRATAETSRFTTEGGGRRASGRHYINVVSTDWECCVWCSFNIAPGRLIRLPHPWTLEDPGELFCSISCLDQDTEACWSPPKKE